ncbi:MAG: SDR family oxidoreductase [Gammaproteobacteria bacterium]
MKAIVTGHTHGLGAALAQALAERGIPVLALARGHAQALADQYPDRVTQFQLNLADSSALGAWLASGGLADFLRGCEHTLLINNAGSVQPIGPMSRQDPLAVGHTLALNVAAPLMLAAAVARQPGERRILHVSSGAGRSAYSGWSVYCATKAALDHHARAAALDAEPGLRIASVAPGIIDTAMQAEIRATDTQLFPMRERFVDLKRNGELTAPGECAAQLMDYLLSDGFGADPVVDVRDF